MVVEEYKNFVDYLLNINITYLSGKEFHWKDRVVHGLLALSKQLQLIFKGCIDKDHQKLDEFV